MDDFADLKAKLDNLKGEGRRKAERKALRAVGGLVKAAIKGRTPFQAGEHAGGRLKPGELAASIKARVHIASAQTTTTGDTSRVTVGPTGRGVVGIATAVEFGHAIVTGARRAKGGKVIGNVPAHPFIRPAADSVEARAVEVYGEVMTAEVIAAMEG